MTTIRIEPFSGISGDMFLGAMAPLASCEEALCQLPRLLNLPEADVRFEDVYKCSIQCRKAVVIDNSPGGAAHDHGHDHEHGHGHHHHDEPGKPHVHAHEGGAPLRGLIEIHQILNEALLAEPVKDLARRIFQIIGEAEAAVHGMDINEVHFHEVGAVDSIVDIVGAALVIHELKVDKVYCDHIITGCGFVHTDHGKLPVPAPATERILYGMPQAPGYTPSELVTPTGAAILKVLEPDFRQVPFTVIDSAWGAGSKDFEHPNALRISVIETVAQAAEVVIIQTNIDDMPGEQLGADFQQKLLDHGALDVCLIPMQMKKSRPGIKLEVLCAPADAEALGELILEETWTLGVRMLSASRKVLPREAGTVETAYGPVRVKIATTPSGARRVIPEYEDCLAMAKNQDVPVHVVYLEALKA